MALGRSRGRLGIIGMVVTANVDRFALGREQLLDDFVLGGFELGRDRHEQSVQVHVVHLPGERLRPVEREVKMGTPVVDGAQLAAR